MITAAFSSKRICDPSDRTYSLATRTTTAFTTSPFFTCPLGAACFTEALITSPIPAYFWAEPLKTRIHMISFAPVLSATFRRVCGWIIPSPPHPYHRVWLVSGLDQPQIVLLQPEQYHFHV